MRVPILVYGVLYVVLEMVGHQLETVGWGHVTPLHVAAALVDALLAIVVAIAVVVLYDVGRRRWTPAWRAWQEQRFREDDEVQPRDPIGVTSWRPDAEPFPVPAVAERIVPRSPTYGTAGTGRRYPEEPGRLL